VTLYEAVIKVNREDTSAKRASDIADGIGYACALLLDEYEWEVDDVVVMREDHANGVQDEAERRAQNSQTQADS